MTALVVNLKPFVETTDEFRELCSVNRDLRFERSNTGDVIIMPPTGGITGLRNAVISSQLGYWSARTQIGTAFDSSTGFQLPNHAIRSPDASWVSQARWETLAEAEKEHFAPLCPDFVIELRSSTDQLGPLRDKMREYMTNGAQLGWLIDPSERRVEIYRIGQPAEILILPSLGRRLSTGARIYSKCERDLASRGGLFP